jgi:hypothetical protein
MALLHVGLDIGSTTAKAVVLDEKDCLIHSTYRRHYADIRTTAGGIMKSHASSTSAWAPTREINEISVQCPEPSHALATRERGAGVLVSFPSIISSARSKLSTLFWGDSSVKNLSGDSDAIQTVSVKKSTARRPAHTRLVLPPISSKIKHSPPRFVSYKYYHETAVHANYWGFLRIFSRVGDKALARRQARFAFVD